MNTDRLIEALVHDLTPARPIAKPWVRATLWLLAGGAYLSILTLVMASPDELARNSRDWPFVFAQLAAILTAATAAAAAFASTVPGESDRHLRLAAIAAVVFVASLGAGAAQEWTRGSVNLAAPGEWGCVAMILLGGALPALGLVLMLRQAAPLTPALTAGMGALATASLASVGACLSHPHPSDAVTLVWHGTTVLLLAAVAASSGRTVLGWKTRLSVADHR